MSKLEYLAFVYKTRGREGGIIEERREWGFPRDQGKSPNIETNVKGKIEQGFLHTTNTTCYRKSHENGWGCYLRPLSCITMGSFPHFHASLEYPCMQSSQIQRSTSLMANMLLSYPIMARAITLSP